MRLNDALLGGILLIFSGAVWAWSQRFPAIPGQEYGASVFPSLVAITLAGCSLVLIVSGLKNGGAAIMRHGWGRDWRAFPRILVMIGSVLFYIFAAKPIGFIPTMTLTLAVNLLLLGVRLPVAIAVAITISVFLQWSFGSLLHVPLSWGILSAYRF